MESSPAAAMAAAPAPSPAPRSRDPFLFASFSLPSGWGCRKPMAFCKDVPTESTDAAAGGKPEPDASQSPLKGAVAAAAAPTPAAATAVQEAPRRQWNLRDRRSGRDFADDAGQHKKPWNMDAGGRSRGFSVELSRQEMEADFVAITGRKPPRRPRRHPKSVQRRIDTIFPGNSLSEICRDRYKVNEKAGF